MPRNMSFFLTTEQMRQRTKTVTRRVGWYHAKAGDIINACVKCQGLGKGGKVEKICRIRVLSIRAEPLVDIRNEADGTTKEGFPEMTPREFVAMFCEANNCTDEAIVNRIEFEYVN